MLWSKSYSKELRPSNHEWVKERLTSPTIHHVDFTQVPADVPNAYSDPNIHFDFNLKENRLIKLSWIKQAGTGSSGACCHTYRHRHSTSYMLAKGCHDDVAWILSFCWRGREVNNPHHQIVFFWSRLVHKLSKVKLTFHNFSASFVRSCHFMFLPPSVSSSLMKWSFIFLVSKESLYSQTHHHLDFFHSKNILQFIFDTDLLYYVVELYYLKISYIEIISLSIQNWITSHLPNHLKIRYFDGGGGKVDKVESLIRYTMF